jgi:glutathione reductase (NADPH)
MRYDLVVIGGGSGGVRAARMAAGFGAKVLLVEKHRLGGTCVNVGCIPKKLLHYAATFSDAFEDAVGFGWTVGPSRFDWATLVRNKDREIERLNGVYAGLLEGAGVEVVHGLAKLTGPHGVSICEDGTSVRDIEAEHVLLAVGGRPWVPPFPGQEHAIVSDQAFHLPSLPKRILIVGGGYIACEFAGIFHGLGSEVHMSVRSEVLTGFDQDIRAAVCEGMTGRGIHLRTKTHLVAVTAGNGGFRALFHDDTTVDVDLVFTATGRLPATSAMGLEESGVKLDPQGAVIVDGQYRTSIPSVYAVGDCTNRLTLTPVALAEGMAVVRTLFGGTPTGVEYDDIPTSVFSQPEVGTVGLSEADARKRYKNVDIYRSRFRPLLNTLSGRAEKMMMKLVVDADTDRVVGVHVVGPEASEIVQGFAVAVRMGAKKADLDRTIGIHPTAAEELVTMRTKA